MNALSIVMTLIGLRNEEKVDLEFHGYKCISWQMILLQISYADL